MGSSETGTGPNYIGWDSEVPGVPGDQQADDLSKLIFGVHPDTRGSDSADMSPSAPPSETADSPHVVRTQVLPAAPQYTPSAAKATPPNNRRPGLSAVVAAAEVARTLKISGLKRTLGKAALAGAITTGEKLRKHWRQYWGYMLDPSESTPMKVVPPCIVGAQALAHAVDTTHLGGFFGNLIADADRLLTGNEGVAGSIAAFAVSAWYTLAETKYYRNQAIEPPLRRRFANSITRNITHPKLSAQQRQLLRETRDDEKTARRNRSR